MWTARAALYVSRRLPRAGDRIARMQATLSALASSSLLAVYVRARAMRLVQCCETGPDQLQTSESQLSAHILQTRMSENITVSQKPVKQPSEVCKDLCDSQTPMQTSSSHLIGCRYQPESWVMVLARLQLLYTGKAVPQASFKLQASGTHVASGRCSGYSTVWNHQRVRPPAYGLKQGCDHLCCKLHVSSDCACRLDMQACLLAASLPLSASGSMCMTRASRLGLVALNFQISFDCGLAWDGRAQAQPGPFLDSQLCMWLHAPAKS